MARLKESTTLRYVLAPLCVALAVALHLSAAGPFLHPTGLFLLCIVAAAWFGGAGPGFVAALLGTLVLPQLIAMNYPLIAGFVDLPRFLTFAMTGVAVGWGATSRRRAEAALRQSEHELRKARNELETKVAQRTAALRSSEERYALANTASEEGFWDWIVATDDFYVSPRLLEMYGFPPETVFAGRNDFLARYPFHPEDRPKWQQAVAAHFAGKTARFDIEIRLLRAGETRWIHLTGLATRNASGEVVRWTGATKDVTARKSAEDALRVSEERYALAMDAAQDAHWDWIVGTGQHYVSPRTLELYGLPADTTFATREEFFAKSIYVPEDQEAWLRAVAALFAGSGSRLSMQLRANVRGETRWVQLSGVCVRDASGKPIRWSGTARDVTDRKHAEQALSLSEERYARAMDAAEAGHWEWNVATDEVFVSAREREMLQLPADLQFASREEFIARVPFHPDDRQPYINASERHIANALPRFEQEYRVILKGGEIRWMRLRGKSTRNKQGVPTHFSGSLIDITEHKLAEALLAGEKRILELIARGGPLDTVLDAICRVFDDLWPGLRSSITLLDANGERLRLIAAPHLPPAFVERMADLPVAGPESGLCGLAVLRGEPVIAEDLGSDPAWQKFRDLYLAHGLGACWSMPFLSEAGKALGTFAVFAREPRGPSKQERGTIEQFGHLASIAVERKRTEEELKRSEERYALAMEAAGDGHSDWILDTGEFYVSPRLLEICGYPPGTSFKDRKDWVERFPFHPEDRQKWEQAVAAHFAGNTARFEQEVRIVVRGETRWVRFVFLSSRDASGKPVRWTGSTTDVTDRKRAELALSLSEERYARAMQASNDGLWDWNPLTDEMFVSERARQLFGIPDGVQVRTRAELKAQGGFHPEDRQRIEEAIQASRSPESGGLDIEYRVINPAGETRWVRSRGKVFPDAQGRPALITGSLSDITERKLAADALRESEARFRSLTELSSDWYWKQDENLRFTYLSSQVHDLTGYSGESSIGKTRWQISNMTPLSCSWPEHQAVLAARQPFRDLECCRVGPDGTIRYLSISGAPIFDEHGRFEGYQGIGRNITERKRIEEELRSRQEMLELAQKSAQAIAFEWRIGEGEGENRWSADLEAMYGLASGTYDGTYETWKKLVHPEDWPAVKEAIEHAHRNGDVASEYRVVHPDGSVHWLQAKGRMFFDRDGKPTRMVGFMQDVTQRRQAEDELRTMERQLRHAQRLEAMGTLAGGIAHDFNNILGAILGYGEMALRDAPKGSRLRRDLDSIMTAGERGRALVDRVLAFSRSGVGERVAVDVEKVVREALDLLKAKLPEGIRVEAQLHAGRAAMLGDPTQVHQVLMNLGTNAVQAMSSGGTLSVSLDAVHFDAGRAATIGTVTAGDYLVLTVADSGVGIAPQIVDRIFDPFFTTKDVGVGTGLGLSLVHGIVTEVGGAIDVASTPGAGSAFTVYLPRAGIAADSPEDEEPAMPRGDRERVLIVDDEEPLVRLATRTLEELGYVPLGFTSSVAALEAFRADPQRFDALITDERMPGMSGSALIREVRGIRKGIPIVLMSGFIGSGVLSRARDAGADEVLKKPLSARELATSLARVLQP